MDATRLWRLEGVVQPYAWGSLTAIPELRGEAPTGTPQAELWLGAHPSAPSFVETEDGDGIALDAWIRNDPESVLGARVARRFGPELPFLLKVLAAAQPLSIQAHPNSAQAWAGFARENAAGVPLDAEGRCYRDPHHKPELICALTPFRALNGFREPTEIVRQIAGLGVSGLEPILEPLRSEPDANGLAAFFESWMTLDRKARARLLDQAVLAASRASDGAPARAEVVRLARAHPGDVGVLAPLFLNLIELAPGEAMYLPAGDLHSYLGGTGIELMANSDNVLRGGLTRKHVDVPELISVLRFEAEAVLPLRPERVGFVEARYTAPAEEFALSVLCVGAGARWTAPVERSAEILLCTEGHALLFDTRGGSLDLPRGTAAVAAAAAGAYACIGELRGDA
jgi:mannose-6-phosphate isomerase